MMPLSARQTLTGFGDRILDLFFPARCVNCRRVTGALCSACLATIQPINSPTCQHCGSLLVSANATCTECRAFPLTIQSIRATAWHEGVSREAVHALKYNRRRDVALPLARLLANEITRSKIQYDLICSVPLHPAREAERGYNQAEILARQTAEFTKSACVSTMERIRNTRDQIGLNSRERRTNVANAFTANSKLVQGRTILVIDDVATTGATLDACAVALLKAGARVVHGLTVTRPRPSP